MEEGRGHRTLMTPFLRSSGFANVSASERSAAFPVPTSHSWFSLRMSSSGGITRFRDDDLCLCCMERNDQSHAWTPCGEIPTYWTLWWARVRLLMLWRR